MSEQDSARLIRVEVMMEELHTRMLGNGQPGFVQKTEARLDEQDDFRSKALGALGVLILALTVFGSTLLAHIFSRPNH